MKKGTLLLLWFLASFANAQLIGFSANWSAFDSRTPDLLKAFGSNVARIDADWQSIEPRKGMRSWSLLDIRVEQLRQHGIKPLIMAGFGSQGYGLAKFQPPLTLDARAGYLRFCRDLATKYPQAVIQVWNEANNSLFWSAPISAASEASLYLDAAAAIHAVNPSQAVLTSGTTFLHLEAGYSYYNEIQRLTGVKPAIHAYMPWLPGESCRPSPEAMFLTLERRIGLKGAYITEGGFNESWILPDPQLGQWEEGDDLLDAIQTIPYKNAQREEIGKVWPGALKPGLKAFSVWLKGDGKSMVRFGLEGAGLAVVPGPKWRRYAFVSEPTFRDPRSFHVYGDGVWQFRNPSVSDWSGDLERLKVLTQEQYRLRSIECAKQYQTAAYLHFTLNRDPSAPGFEVMGEGGLSRSLSSNASGMTRG